MNPRNFSVSIALLLVLCLMVQPALSEKKISVAVNLNGAASGSSASPGLVSYVLLDSNDKPVSGLPEKTGSLRYWVIFVVTKNLAPEKQYKLFLETAEKDIVGSGSSDGATLNSKGARVLISQLDYALEDGQSGVTLKLVVREMPFELIRLENNVELKFGELEKPVAFRTSPSIFSSDEIASAKLWLTNFGAGLAGFKDQIKSVRFRQCQVNAPPAPDASGYKFIVPEVCKLSMPISTAPIDEPPGYNLLDFYEPTTTGFRSQVVSLAPTIEVSTNGESKAVDGESVLVTAPEISKLAISVFDKNKKPIQMIQPADGPIMICFRVLPDEPAISQDFRVQLFVNNQMVFNGFEETPADYFSRYMRLKNSGFSDCWSSGPFFSDYLTGESNANSNGLNWNVNEWDSLSGDVDWKKALFNMGANPFPSPFASSSATLGGASGMAFPMDVPVGNKVRIRVALLSKSNKYMALGQQDFSVLSQAITFVPDRVNIDSPPEKIEVTIPKELAKGVNRTSLDLSLFGCDFWQCAADRLPAIPLTAQPDGSLTGEILYSQLSKLKQFFMDSVAKAKSEGQTPAELEVKVTATSVPAEPSSQPNPDFLDDPPGYLPAEALVLLSQQTALPVLPQEISVPKTEGFELALYSIDPTTREFRELPFLTNVPGGPLLVRVQPSDFPIALGWKYPLFSWSESGFYPKEIWVDSKPVFVASPQSVQSRTVQLLAKSFSGDFFWDPSWSNPMTFGTYEPDSVLWTNNGWRGVAPSAPSPIYMWSKTRFELSVDLGSLDSGDTVGSGKILVDMPLFETYAAPATVEPDSGEFGMSFEVSPEAEALLEQNPEAEFWWWNENAVPGAPPEKIVVPVAKITENGKIVWGIAKEKADTLFERLKTTFSNASSGSLPGIVAVDGQPVQAVSLQKSCSSLLECLANLDKQIISILFGGGQTVTTFVPVPVAAGSPVSSGAKPQVCVGNHCVTVELAQTEQELEKGLANRDSLNPNTGMLFVFQAPTNLQFTMDEMRFGLDFVWIGSDKKIVGLTENRTPCALHNLACAVPAPAPYQFVLELNAGEAAAWGLSVGDPVEFNPSLEDLLEGNAEPAPADSVDVSAQYYQSTQQWLPVIEIENVCSFCDPDLIQRIIFVESSGRPDVVSPSGAIGLMQVSPIALQELLGAKVIEDQPYDLTDPADNIFIGTVYLEYLWGVLKFNGNRENFETLDYPEQYDLALEAYHVGPTVVNENGHTPDGIAYLERLANVP